MSTILALDYGEKRVGVAISDPTGTLASPLPFIPPTPKTQFFEALKKIIEERQVGLILVGFPRNMDGSLGDSAQKVQTFIDQLKKALSIDIQAVDERLSTVQASRLLSQAGHSAKKQKQKIDSAAAQVLLQQFLDSKSNFN